MIRTLTSFFLARCPQGESDDAMTVHATTVCWKGRGLLLRGAAGSGKSDLALRLIAQGARLIADDLTTLYRKGDRLEARLPNVPSFFRGKLALRGAGLLHMPYRQKTRIHLVADLSPEPSDDPYPSLSCQLMGLTIPRIVCSPFEASADIKMLYALQQR
ncbi:MAG: HPr kinase/phosphatase C-terminal domain-containing protein [Alphaproteobacteria bacterium GM202ARS2]|nr:HPr kinase/phosphatase C-terminal domain-containing protein [Alphaproteobacteria bacterium GM202ARS2]